MTIMIKQLVIRAVVDAPRASDQRAVGAGPSVNGARSTGEPAATWPAEDRRRLIAECVRGVMRELERARRR